MEMKRQRTFDIAALRQFAAVVLSRGVDVLLAIALHTACLNATLAADAAVVSPKVLWVHRTDEHFIAAPVVTKDILYVSGLGAFNTGNFHALSTAASGDRVRWSKTPPYLKLPVVSAPVVQDNQVLFGDGMHQTDGATLHCLDAGSGQCVWQFAMPGDLVHMEGTPVVSGSRVYMGGGNAGVFCVDGSRLTLDGAELDGPAIATRLEMLWKQFEARYETDKKNDPDLAVPPSRDDLPRPAPKLVWQQGQGKWHVDAGVTLAAGKLLAASAYLDAEKQGERALIALNPADGSTLWKTPLKFNPWGAPRATDTLALVGCSNIRFDPKEVKKGRGEIVAVKLDDGSVAWRKPVFGGIVSPLALAGSTIIAAGSDGQLQAWNAESGKLLWSYSAGAPMFAGPATTADVVYAADLNGVVHCVGLADGKRRWTLDLAKDAAVHTPGMIYGAPLVADGRLYVATCNLEQGDARRECVVVCIGLQ